jgi:hypothetical protein
MTTDIVSRCDVVYLEDLKVKNMTATARGTVEEPCGVINTRSSAFRAERSQSARSAVRIPYPKISGADTASHLCIIHA